jgi:hypothetical protein
MAIALSDSLLVQTAKPADDKYGPWKGDDIAECIDAVTVGGTSSFPLLPPLDSTYRYQGLTVGLLVLSSGGTHPSGPYDPVVEYWFKDGIADNQLIQKTSSSNGGSIEIFQTGTSLSTDVRSIDVNQGKGNGLITQIKALTNSGSSTAANFTATTGITLDFDPTSVTGTPQGIVGNLATTTTSASGTGATLSVNVKGGTVVSVRIDSDPSGQYVNGDDLIIAAGSIGINSTGTTDTLIKLDTADFDSDGYISKEKVILNTLFDTQLPANSVTGNSAVGGVAPATSITSFSGDSVVDVLNKILFPTQLPTYKVPTLTTSENVNPNNQEIGASISPIITSTANTFDASDFEDQVIKRDGITLQTTTHTAPNPTAGSFPSTGTGALVQFGFTSPNAPAKRVTDTFTDTGYVIPGISGTPSNSNNRSVTTYSSTANIPQNGQRRKNSLGVDDSRAFGTNANSPQIARTLSANASSFSGYYPWFYYVAPSTSSSFTGANQATANFIKAEWVAGNIGPATSSAAGYTIGSAAGNVLLPGNAASSYLAIAIPAFYNSKTTWDATPPASNTSTITAQGAGGAIEDGNFLITLDSLVPGRWSGVSYKVYLTPIATTFGPTLKIF